MIGCGADAENCGNYEKWRINMELHWQLPMASSEKNSTGYIHGNAKVHLFIDSYDSVCGRYEQDVNYYDDADESEINERDCCKKCWKKYIELTENRG